jgi:hypothetical protein
MRIIPFGGFFAVAQHRFLSFKVHSFFLAKLMMIQKNALSKTLLLVNKLKNL